MIFLNGWNEDKDADERFYALLTFENKCEKLDKTIKRLEEIKESECEK